MSGGRVRVELERSGGFTGLRRCALMDTETLPDDEARWLRDTVGGLDLDELARSEKDPRLPALDLVFLRGGCRVRVSLDERQVTTELRPLIQELDRRAQPC
jgi:hypothetical protein